MKGWRFYVATGLMWVGGFATAAILCEGSLVAPALGHHAGRVPACAEDEMVAGRGDFEHGKWTRYVCVHPDDVVAETIENDHRNPAVHASVAGSVCEYRRFWKRQQGITILPEACDG